MICTVEDLAASLDVSEAKLHRLERARYRRFTISKRRGGERHISVPPPDLAAVQRRILVKILDHQPVEPQAHGFVQARSIVTGAAPHVNKAVVVNLDLKDFFPSVDFARVRELFKQLGYRGQLATALALLCTEQVGAARLLPQGACTSPAITNLICRRLDKRLHGLCVQAGFVYTRYADDLTLSGNVSSNVERLLRHAREIIRSEGFTVHPRKTRVMPRTRRQEVTGLTVNVRPDISRRERRLLRAVLHNAGEHGIESQNRDGREDFAQYLTGRVEYASMVAPDKAAEWHAKLDKARESL
jgi:RNA-directed DNA polymerase